MKKFLAIIILISFIKNSSIGQHKASRIDSNSIALEKEFCFFDYLNSKNSNEDFKVNLWKIDSYLRGANVHPYRHFSPFSMRDPISKEDLTELKRLGANLVVANYPGIFTYFPPYQIDSLGLMNLDKIVQFAEQLKFFLVLSLRSGPGRSLYTFFDKYREDEILFNDSTAQEKYIEMCKMIVDRYKDKKYLVGINFLLEPHGDDPVYFDRINDSVYFNFIERLIKEVRRIDSKIPIIVQPQGWAYPDKFASMKKFDDENIVYSFDMYFPHSFTNELNDSTYPGFYFDKDSLVYVDTSYLRNFLSSVNNFKKKYGVPVFVNEYGGIRFKKGMINYIKDLHKIFLENGFHFAFYVWKSEWGEIDGNSFDEYNYEKGTDREKDLTSTKRNDNELLKELQFIWNERK